MASRKRTDLNASAEIELHRNDARHVGGGGAFEDVLPAAGQEAVGRARLCGRNRERTRISIRNRRYAHEPEQVNQSSKNQQECSHGEWTTLKRAEPGERKRAALRTVDVLRKGHVAIGEGLARGHIHRRVIAPRLPADQQHTRRGQEEPSRAARCIRSAQRSTQHGRDSNAMRETATTNRQRSAREQVFAQAKTAHARQRCAHDESVDGETASSLDDKVLINRDARGRAVGGGSANHACRPHTQGQSASTQQPAIRVSTGKRRPRLVEDKQSEQQQAAENTARCAPDPARVSGNGS